MSIAENRIRRLADGPASKATEYFSSQSKSFSYAARLFPADLAKEVTAVYAFCRFTDDLVDTRPSTSASQIEEDLVAWTELARSAHAGETTGIAVLDISMHSAGRRSIPFRYAEELIRGVAMDVEPRLYHTLDELWVYTHRVAGVVGQWLTQLFGISDPEILEAAAWMGHAMQLTNIVRDVGDDLRMGRIYLPRELMVAHGVEPGWLEEAAAGRTGITAEYADLLEEAMALADARYRAARSGVPALPREAQQAVVVAASVYRAIHGRVRRNHYDNLTRRAVVPKFEKRWRAAGALAALPVLRYRHRKAGRAQP